MGLYLSKYSNNTNHKGTGQNEYYHRIIKQLVSHVDYYAGLYATYLAIFFVFFMNDKNIKYINENRGKFYNISDAILTDLKNFFIRIKNLQMLRNAFPKSKVFGSVVLINLPNPVVKKYELYKKYKANNALKKAGFGQKELELAYQMIKSDKIIVKLINQNPLHILTDEIFDRFMQVFDSFSPDIVKKNLLNNFFYASKEDYDKFQQYIKQIFLFCFFLFFMLSIFFIEKYLFVC